jgi:hypothetical protein
MASIIEIKQSIFATFGYIEIVADNIITEVEIEGITPWTGTTTDSKNFFEFKNLTPDTFYVCGVRVKDESDVWSE